MTGSHNDNNKYYIYCSVYGHDGDQNCKDVWSKATGYKSQSDFNNRNNGIIPVIPPYTADIFGITHKRGGQPASIPDWGEYITNNPDAYEVRKIWNDGDQDYSTTNRIYIWGPTSGSSVFDVTLDRVFIRATNSFLEKYGSITIGHDKKTDKDGKEYFEENVENFTEKVTLRLKNNNVLNRIHYKKPIDNTSEGYLRITSADGDGVAKGTLLVAPAHNGGDTEDNKAPARVVVGLIGAATSDEGDYGDERGKRGRQVKDLYIDGGIVYVGARKFENSNWSDNQSLMTNFGGVNSQTEITITGGILTAVSNNTCPAIGSGGGWESSGGKGVVTITGGTVYAYSFGVLGTFDEKSTIVAPPAIGGGSTLGEYIEDDGKFVPANAGSCDVKITGGNFSMPKGGNGEISYNAADASSVLTWGTYYGGNGGGLCVDMSGSSAKAAITIGYKEGSVNTPDIESNSAALSGGGMAIEGEGSDITIYSGTIKGNVSAFVKNEDIRNDGGKVDLVGKNSPGVVDKVDVKYNTVKFYANNGVDPEPYDEQRVITSTNSPLHPTEKALAFEKEFYHITQWNTKRDGSGTKYELNGGETVNITSDMSLYAQWAKNQ